MSYRDDIMSYTDECLEGVRATLEEPRVKALGSEDIEQIIEQLRELSTKADLVLMEARAEREKA